VPFEALRRKSVVGQKSMFYVYILQSQTDKSYYAGFTEDLKNRIKEHNTGKSKFTATKGNYELIWYCAFSEKSKEEKTEVETKKDEMTKQKYWVT